MARIWHLFRQIVPNGRYLVDLADGIRVFVAAVEAGSFSGAAARLRVSPKLASKYMAELEQRLGAQLLHRTTQRLGMTLAGEGIALCPDYVVREDLAAGRLLRVLSDSSGPALDIHALHLGQRRVARRTRALLDFLVRDRFGELFARS